MLLPEAQISRNVANSSVEMNPERSESTLLNMASISALNVELGAPLGSNRAGQCDVVPEGFIWIGKMDYLTKAAE
jgi:hypothetical protein